MHPRFQKAESAEEEIRVEHVRDHIVDELGGNLLVLLLRVELVVGVSEYVVHHQADAQQLHRHVEGREDLPPRIFVVKVGLDLRDLDEEQLLVVGVEGYRVDVPEYIPVHEVADQANHSGCLLRVNVCLGIIQIGPTDRWLLLIKRDFCILRYSLIRRNEFVGTFKLFLGFL